MRNKTTDGDRMDDKKPRIEEYTYLARIVEAHGKRAIGRQIV